MYTWVHVGISNLVDGIFRVHLVRTICTYVVQCILCTYLHMHTYARMYNNIIVIRSKYVQDIHIHSLRWYYIHKW